MSVTLLEIARARGIHTDERGSMNAADFEAVGLPMIGGCESCGATVAAYNGYPSRTGYIRCAGCLGNLGFDTPAAFEDWNAADPDDGVTTA